MTANIVNCKDIQHLAELCAEFTKLGLTFYASTTVLTITLTGGF